MHYVQTRTAKYTEEQKQMAVNYYIEHGQNIAKTIRELGYPNRHYLKQWLIERDPKFKYRCKTSKSLVNLPKEEKIQAVIALCSKEYTGDSIAKKYGVNRVSLYNWKHQLLGDKEVEPMTKKQLQNVSELQNEISKLNEQAEILKRQVYQFQLEKDILEKATEIIKKNKGISLQTLTNREKAMVIDTLRNKYSLKELLSVFHMAKSSYCYQANALKAPDKYEKERKMIQTSFINSKETYGYRRIYFD